MTDLNLTQEQSVKISDQLAAYDDYWSKFAAQILEGRGAGNFVESESHVVCATIVARLPQSVSSTLVEALSPLRAKFPNHYFYPSDTIHFTLIDVSSVAENGDFDRLPPVAMDAFSILAKELLDERPLKLRLCGLGVFPTTILGQLLDLEDRVNELRERVSASVRRETGAVLRPPVTPGLVFANLVRYSSVPQAGIIEEISVLRTRPDRLFDVADFELVATDKVLSWERTTVHGRLTLAG